MTSTDQNNTPFGLYILSGLILLSILRVSYNAMATPKYFYIAIILVPLFTYMGIGIIKRWAGAKDLVMAVSVLLFVGVIPNIIDVFLTENTRELPGIIHLVEDIVQLAVFPAVYTYFKRENVKSYFKPATSSRINDKAI